MASFDWLLLLLFIAAGLLCEHADCYSVLHRRNSSSRRVALSQIGAAFATVSLPANAKEDGDIALVTDATDALSSLIENWERATVDCTYADVPRELLETKNKEKLLEKASEFALFDKSTSVVSCKRTNRVVRDYIGVTGKGPLVNLEKKLLKKSLVEQVDPDNLDDYFSAVETFSQEMAKANSLSYTAGTADFDSVNNFAKGEAIVNEGDSNLEQARRAIEEANKALKIASSLIAVS
mmetsp:Transcript_28777/g.48970  ORF Transcript_28777/g.48970 Transcript_28777/m.48970 type:complete len:237 (+) Transcript_28777:58-768(+)